MSYAYTQYSDGDLVRLCIGRDPLAWETLVRRYQDLVYSIPMKYGFEPAECREIGQNVWVLLLNNLRALRNAEKVYSWLWTTTNRECHSFWSKRKQRPEPEEQPAEPSDPAGTAEEMMLSAEKDRLLHRLVERCGDPCRLLIRALYFEQRSYEEAADLLGVSREGIGARRIRCLERLRGMLVEEGISSC